MFKKALQKIKSIRRKRTLFAFFLLTLNTHERKGFLKPQCDFKFDIKFKGIISGTDRQVERFIKELGKEQLEEKLLKKSKKIQ